MVMNDLLPPPLCNVNRPSHSEIQLFQNLTMKIHGQGHVCGQRSRSRLTFKIQRSRLWSRSNPLVISDIANSIFDLEKSRSRSRRKSTKMLSGNLQVRANNRAKSERNPKSCSKVVVWTRICGRRRRRRQRTNRYKNIVTPGIPGWLNNMCVVSLTLIVLVRSQVRMIGHCMIGQVRGLLCPDWPNWWVCPWVPAFEIQIFLTP